jgi:hypothetical protein
MYDASVARNKIGWISPESLSVLIQQQILGQKRSHQRVIVWPTIHAK